MKILFVIDNLSTGGAQRQMVNLAVGLANRQHQIQVFCYATGDKLAQPLYDAGIPVHWHHKRVRYPLGAIFALRDLIRKERFDLVLSYLRTPNFLSVVSSRLTIGKSTPVIISERSSDLTGYVNWVEQVIRQSYRLADYVVVNSFHQRDNFVRKYPWLKDRICTIYNGYDLQTFIPAPVEHGNCSLKILVIASVSPYKNGLCLIEALNVLRQTNQVCPEVTWIGERVRMGDRLDCLNQMDQKIHSYGLEAQWHWLDQRSDVVKQLHQHDVLILPSYAEGLPNVVCEAMACGRPVIVSDTLDHPLLIKHEVNGYLFDWRNPADLAQKISMFNSLSVEKRQQMGQQGRRFAEEHLGMDRLVDEYEQLFQSRLRRRS